MAGRGIRFRIRFHIVDVFAGGRYSGNQLAVVLPEKPIPAGAMQRIAAEFNFAETTFVTGEGRSPGEFRVRIFTPRKEVPFAGHPVLGTAHVLRALARRARPSRIVLRLKAGKVPVDFDDRSGLAWLRSIPPVFGAGHRAAAAARLLGLEAREVDSRFPAREVSTGIPFLFIPLVSLEAVRKARFDGAAFDRYFGKKTGPPLFLFTRETYSRENQINCRMFAPHFGIPEDPATGSANACLGAYVIEHGYLDGDPVEFRVEQGFEIGRNSLLHVRAGSAEDAGIRVGGKVVDIADGRLR